MYSRASEEPGHQGDRATAAAALECAQFLSRVPLVCVEIVPGTSRPMVVNHGRRVGVHADQYRDAVDQAEQIAGLGTWEWTPDTGELWWSENLFRLFGLAPGEIVPSAEYVVARTVPEDRQKAEQALTAVLTGEFGDQLLEYRIVRPDGAMRAHRVVVVAAADRRLGPGCNGPTASGSSADGPSRGLRCVGQLDLAHPGGRAFVGEPRRSDGI